MGHHIEGSVDFIAHGAASAGALRDFNLPSHHRFRCVWLRQGREQELNELAIPHALLGAIARRGRHFQAGENHGAG